MNGIIVVMAHGAGSILMNENEISIGLKSGEYGGKYIYNQQPPRIHISDQEEWGKNLNMHWINLNKFTDSITMVDGTIKENTGWSRIWPHDWHLITLMY
jgi:hypothetical protein